MRIYKSDVILCWICDYSMFVLSLLLILLLSMWRLQNVESNIIPVVHPIITLTDAVPTIINTLISPTLQPTSTQGVLRPTSPLLTSMPEKPEFVLIFVPVNWQSSSQAFQEVAQNQVDIFIRESDFGQYFIPKVIILQDGLQNVSLSNENLGYDVLEFGLQKQAGDRYIGLTDGDLQSNGNSDIVGWTTFGGQAVIAESIDPYVVAHELGHTFGLCDEYSYSDWSRQNGAISDGCPNPYPENCPQVESTSPNCDGDPTRDGRNSIMGPAGLVGLYGYNNACLFFLEDIFQSLLDKNIR